MMSIFHGSGRFTGIVSMLVGLTLAPVSSPAALQENAGPSTVRPAVMGQAIQAEIEQGLERNWIVVRHVGVRGLT